MTPSTIWWLLAGGAVALELLTGTFYLLMLASGMACAAVAASLGASLVVQILVAAGVGGGALAMWHQWQLKKGSGSQTSAQADPNAYLDIGEIVHIVAWKEDGSADVRYRGAHWTAVHRPGASPEPGPHRVAELLGNRLLVEKA
jgi:membrane protein implicated in regulation of membrane protease activity